MSKNNLKSQEICFTPALVSICTITQTAFDLGAYAKMEDAKEYKLSSGIITSIYKDDSKLSVHESFFDSGNLIMIVYPKEILNINRIDLCL